MTTITIIRRKVVRVTKGPRWGVAHLSCGHKQQLGSLTRERAKQREMVCQTCTGATFDLSKLVFELHERKRGVLL